MKRQKHKKNKLTRDEFIQFCKEHGIDLSKPENLSYTGGFATIHDFKPIAWDSDF